MPEATQITFTHQELVELLVKKSGVHEGFWGISFEVGMGAAPPVTPASIPGAKIVPAFMVLINKVGIMRFEQPNPMTVDASQVNPLSPEPASAK
jgi:hypothetical protein